MTQRTVAADPYPWPYNGDLRPANTAFLVIDMQTDFCGPGGYVDKMGYDISLTRAPIAPIKRLLAALRARGYHIFHTRAGARARSAPASAILVPAARSWYAASPAGRSSRSWHRPRARPSSTSPARA